MTQKAENPSVTGTSLSVSVQILVPSLSLDRKALPQLQYESTQKIKRRLTVSILVGKS